MKNWKCKFRTLNGLMALLVVWSWGMSAKGQTFDEKFEHWPTQLRIDGRIIVNCSDSESVINDLDGQLENKEVVCLQMSEVKIPIPATTDDSDLESKSIELDAIASNKSFANLLSDAEVLLVGPAKPGGMVKLQGYLPELKAFLKSDGTLIVDSSVAAWLGKVVVSRREKSSGEIQSFEVREGFNLIPDCLLITDYRSVPEYANDEDASSDMNYLQAVTALRPRLVGIGLPSEGQLFLDGRKFWMQGSGRATFQLAANDRQPVRTQVIAERRRRRQPPEEYLLDLTEWRRDAIDRTLPPFPPAKPPVPNVENGTLFIVGGGGMPNGLMAEFVKAAGGANARLVYVPCSERDEVRAPQRIVESWNKMGVESATFIHTKDREQANSDEEFMAPLVNATGIWFGGGRQWNFADSYYGTKTHQLMKEVLKRGGAIGGSSAGASIQARYLARATPIGNFRPMAPGYERGGLGFLGGVAIDQHFSQRRRQPDMTDLVNRYPQLLGIGIDEATALVVKKSVGQVVGRGKVFFYDRTQPVYPDRPDYVAVPAGGSYDLAVRKVIESNEKEDEKEEPKRSVDEQSDK